VSVASVAAGAKPAYRAAFVAGSAAFALAFVIGAVASFRSDSSLPAPSLLVDGTAAYVRQLLSEGDYRGAVQQLRAYEYVSNDRLPHEQLGEALLRLGPEARAGFAAALGDGGPGYAQGHYQLGLAFEGAEEYGPAVAELEEAVKLRPTFAEAQNALGVALINDGRAGEASAHFQEAVSQGYAPAVENLQHLEALVKSAGAKTR
jgi:Flp pilus assembly protein TadD